MERSLYKVKVPGSLMLFGEHAVLHGAMAIVAAMDKYVEVTLIPRSDARINIDSDEFGHHGTHLGKIKSQLPYDYVLTAILKHAKRLRVGFDLNIVSDFSSNIGLGSSAAITVAVLGILTWWLRGKPESARSLYRKALEVIQDVKKIGSGADVAASIFGGILAYNAKPLIVEQLGTVLPLSIIYSGSKVPTFKVVAKVAREQKRYPEIFAKIYAAMDHCSRVAKNAIAERHYGKLGTLMNIHQGLQDALGVSNGNLANIIFALRASPGIRGAKISGSGLGDCVIGMGKIEENVFHGDDSGVREIRAKVSSVGISYLS